LIQPTATSASSPEATPPSAPSASPGSARSLELLCVLSLVFVLPSARLWLSSPLILTQHEFDYWLGLFAFLGPTFNPLAVLVGRALHLAGFLVLGLLFCPVARAALAGEDVGSVRRTVKLATILALVWTLGMPWVSPDVFFYIATGWLDVHYHLSPYLHGLFEASGATTDPMFSNVVPPFMKGTTAYGPLFQLVARAVAMLSGGSQLVALGLYKLIALAAHAANGALLWRLAPLARRQAALLFYCCNPLVLFSLLTCAHNDGLMMTFVLAALVCRNAARPGLAGAMLGCGVAVKYAPIILLPLFVVDLCASGDAPWSRRILAIGRFGLGLAAALVAFHLLYPESLSGFLHVATGGIGVYRNSIYHVLIALTGKMPLPPITRQILNGAFAVAAVAATLIFWREALRTRRFRLSEACLLIWSLYFVLPNQTNQEWYLAWLLALVAVVPLAAVEGLGLRLSLLFMPLVIFTVRNAPVTNFAANVLLYLLLAGSVVAALPSLLFPKPPPEPAR